MYNDILDAITCRLNELFGDDYAIHTDPVRQGLKEPCFFVQFLEPTEKPMVGRRYFRDTGIAIQYLLGEQTEILREMNRAADLLMDGMEYITLSDGDILRGTDRSTRSDLEERVLTFLVNYNAFIIKPAEEVPGMDELSAEIGKG